MNSYKGSRRIENEARRLELMSIIANDESRRILAKIRESGFNPKVIADFGCGTGDAFGIFEDMFSNATIVGFDQSAKAISLASERYPETKLFTVDMKEEDAFSATLNQVGRIDLAYFRNVLLHLPEPTEVLRNVKNHVSSGGVLFAQEPDWNTAEANWTDFSIFKEALTTMMQAIKINPYMGNQLKTVFEDLHIQDINIDISTRKVTPADRSWDILYYLLEVGGNHLTPYLQEKGVKGVEEMKQRIEAARMLKDSYYKTPAWVILWGKR